MSSYCCTFLISVEFVDQQNTTLDLGIHLRGAKRTLPIPLRCVTIKAVVDMEGMGEKKHPTEVDIRGIV
jgi:hypothetical protein